MPTIEQQGGAPQRPHHGRLQRGPTVAGYRVSTFHDVLQRHGLTMGLLAGLCLIIPGTLSAIATTTTRLTQQPGLYLLGLIALLLFFSHWSGRRPIPLTRQSQWILYLLFISIVEDLTFRLVIPGLLSQPFSGMTAHVLSNLVFAGIHYVTLRWKLRNCIAVFIGGMGLSQLMTQGDFALVVMAHWLGTFLNTPFPPAASKD